MKIQGQNIEIYDNNESFDRYTVIHDDKINKTKHFYAMSMNPNSPQGFNQYVGSTEDGYKAGKHLGKKLKFIPSELIVAIENRIK